MNTIRFGIVGLGVQGSLYKNLFLGNIYGTTIAAPKQCRLTAICDPSIQAKEVAEELQIPYFSDYHKLNESDACDAIVITVPHLFHKEITIDALQHGKHVLCEKPTALRASDVMDMQEATTPQTKFGIMHHLRANPLFQSIKQILTSKELGLFRNGIWISNQYYRPDTYYSEKAWRGTWDGEGGGILVNQIPHQLDLLLWFLGVPSAVTCHLGEGRYRQIEVDNELTAILQYPDETTMTLTANTYNPLGTERLELNFSKGKLVMENNQTLTITRFKEEETTWNTNYTYIEFMNQKRMDATSLYTQEEKTFEVPFFLPYITMFENFADAVLKDVPLIASAEDGFQEVSLANSLYLSSWQNTTIAHPSSMDTFNQLYEKKIQ